MKTIIVNCAEYKNLLDCIKQLSYEKLIDIKQIIDYDEYKDSYFEYDMEFTSFYEHIRLRNDEISLNKYKNISSDVIEFSNKYFKTGLDILQNRHVKPGIEFKFNESIDLFYGSLNRSISEIKDNNIELIIFNHVPHHFNTFILYISAKYCGIKTLIVTKLSWNGFRYFLDSNIGERGWSIKKRIKCSNLSLQEDEKLYFEIKNRSFYEPPVYMQKKYNRQSVIFLHKVFGNSFMLNILISLYGGWEIGFFKRRPFHLKWSYAEKFNIEKYPFKILQVLSQIKSRYKILKIAKVYKKISQNVLSKLKNSNYILFAPNYQPEATTLPSAFDFSNTLLCLKLLRAKLPENIYIFYKEHEDIFNINLEADRSRSKDFYNQISKIDNLIIVSRNCSQIDLIDNAKFIVIQTSNIGLDALIRGKPVISFGPTWFDDMTGIISWKIFESKYNYSDVLSLDVKFDHDLIKIINHFTVRLEDTNNPKIIEQAMRKIFIEAIDL